jgi:hypothetical protein
MKKRVMEKEKQLKRKHKMGRKNYGTGLQPTGH